MLQLLFEKGGKHKEKRKKKNRESQISGEFISGLRISFYFSLKFFFFPRLWESGGKKGGVCVSHYKISLYAYLPNGLNRQKKSREGGKRGKTWIFDPSKGKENFSNFFVQSASPRPASSPPPLASFLFLYLLPVGRNDKIFFSILKIKKNENVRM